MKEPKKIGIIGAGRRGVWNLGKQLIDRFPQENMLIVALCDTYELRLQEAGHFIKNAHLEVGVEQAPKLYTDIDAFLQEDLDLVMITTQTFAHRECAEKALKAGKRVYVDKPLAATAEDCAGLLAAQEKSGTPFLMGFTRRYESSWNRAYQLMQEGLIGDLHMMHLQASMPLFSYFHRWHRERKNSGDGLNDKSSHHFDVFNWFAGSQIDQVSAFGGTRVFKAKADAPLRCIECDLECPYRGFQKGVVRKGQNHLVEDGQVLNWVEADNSLHRIDTCVYQEGADIIDHAHINVRYQNGIVAHLQYAAFAWEHKEIFTLIGDRGQIRLDRDGSLDIIADHGKSRYKEDVKDDYHELTHHGADVHLVACMRRYIEGERAQVNARQGYEATLGVLAALESIDRNGDPLAPESLLNAEVSR